jgi:hypothetical protein
VYPWEGFTVSNKPSIGNKLATSVYPNPAKDKIVIKLENPSGTVYCSIYDHSGRLVQQENLLLQQGTAHLSLPVGLRRGLYIVKLNSGAQLSTHKLLIEQ